VPAGAASAPITVNIAKTSVGAPALPSGASPSAAVYEITPHGAVFDKAVEVAIPFDPATISAGQRPILLKAERGGDWAAVTDVRADGAMLHALVSDFSYFSVVSCQAYANVACAPAAAIALQIAAPSISSSAESVVVPPPVGSGADLLGVAVEHANIQMSVQLTVPASCMNRFGRLSLVVYSNQDPVGLRREPSDRMHPLLKLSYTGQDQGIVVRRSRMLGGELVIDATAFFSFYGDDFNDSLFSATATCHVGGAIQNLILESAPVRIGYDRNRIRASGHALAIRESPSDQTVAVGQTAFFFLTSSAYGTESYQWERSDDGGNNWVTIAGAQSARFELVEARASDNGARFRAIVTDQNLVTGVGFSTVTSAGALLTVGGPVASVDPVLWQTDSTLAAGGSASMAIQSDKTLWTWGSNNGGVLGRSNTDTAPYPVETLHGVRSVASGAWYAVALLDNQDVYAWGWGENVGAAIVSTTQDNPVPMKVVGLSGIRAISTKYRHTLALDSNGKVFGFGPERFGGLGPLVGNDGTRQIAGISDVRQIAAGELHSLALRSDGTVWAWGANSVGQLGVAPSSSIREVPAAVPGLTDVVAIAASSFGSFALRRDGSVWSWGASNVLGRVGTPELPQAIPGLSGVATLAAGNYSVFALNVSGQAFGWGDNVAGRIGVNSLANSVDVPTAFPSTTPAFVQIVGGEVLGLALAADGRVFAWGSNGAAGLDGTGRSDSATPIDSGFAIAR
jgi:alpha-tubulin suppressor-like RCC1 family protein